MIRLRFLPKSAESAIRPEKPTAQRALRAEESSERTLRFCPEKRGAAEVDLSGRSDSAVSIANGGVLQEDVAISPEERRKRDSHGSAVDCILASLRAILTEDLPQLAKARWDRSLSDSAVSIASGGVLQEDVAVLLRETRRSRRARSCRSVSARRPLPRISFAR